MIFSGSWGCIFHPGGTNSPLTQLIHHIGLSVSTLQSQYIISIFLSYMPRMYTKGSRMIPGWIEAEEKIQEIEFNYWVQIQHRWYP